MCLAHYVLESNHILILIIVIMIIVIVIIELHAGVLELMEFIRKENIKTLVEHIVEQHIERYSAVPQLPPRPPGFAAHVSA